jgi:hypothetical protein
MLKKKFTLFVIFLGHYKLSVIKNVTVSLASVLCLSYSYPWIDYYVVSEIYG